MLSSTHTNRLARESSPYLLQHQHNPVDWYPWGDEAFAAARAQNKPIFLSVGYSTCYWCHVMERQCFEVPAIAAEMNKRFINIKVDREERPDVDQLYMTATQILTRHGGWPMSVFLTPDLRPFYAGTYFPPEDTHGRPGFPKLLASLEDAFHNRRPAVDETADQLLSILHQLASPRRPEHELTFNEEKLEDLLTRSTSDFDPANGGYGSAPKFPRQTLLKLLLTYLDQSPPDRAQGTGHRAPSPLSQSIRHQLTVTLDALDRGGIHDHLGGGFHRYSTDAHWLVPHFEIMLYDQAMLAEVFAVAARVLNEPRWAGVARGICDFVLREMTSPEGAFYTAFDAEVDHREGLNYLWTEAEIGLLLGAEDAALFNCIYGVDQGPNFADPHHGTGEPDANILFLDRPLPTAAHEHGVPLPELESRLAKMRARLKSARDARKQPLLDTKILTGWNALMASALAIAGHELHEPRYLAAAKSNCDFLLKNHRNPDGMLLRTSRGGQAKFPAFLDDYAALAQACLSLKDPGYTHAAELLTSEITTRFGSPQKESCSSCNTTTGCSGTCGGGNGGGYFFTDITTDDLIVRQKLTSDSPLPSGNAQALSVLLTLGQKDRAEALLKDFAQPLDDNAESASSLLEGLLRYTRTHGPLIVPPSKSATNIPTTPHELARRAVEVEARFETETVLHIRLTITEGFHINATENLPENLIPTSLTLPGATITYPTPDPKPYPTYTGQIILTATFPTPPTTLIKGTLTYQPCDESSCLSPITRPLEIHP